MKTLFQNGKPITIQSDNGTEFVNRTVQPYLKRQGESFHTTHNPDIKGPIFERVNRTLKTKMCKYFTKNNTYRYLDVINKLLAGYNNSVHYTTGMLPSKVNPSNIYPVWRMVNRLRAKILQGRVKFKFGDFVRIKKEKLKFAQGYEQTFSTEVFRVVKVIQCLPQPVYELSDLQDRAIEGQFYNSDLVKLTLSPQTEFQIDKSVRTRNKGDINNNLSSGEGATRH